MCNCRTIQPTTSTRKKTLKIVVILINILSIGTWKSSLKAMVDEPVPIKSHLWTQNEKLYTTTLPLRNLLNWRSWLVQWQWHKFGSTGSSASPNKLAEEKVISFAIGQWHVNQWHSFANSFSTHSASGPVQRTAKRGDTDKYYTERNEKGTNDVKKKKKRRRRRRRRRKEGKMRLYSRRK